MSNFDKDFQDVMHSTSGFESEIAISLMFISRICWEHLTWMRNLCLICDSIENGRDRQKVAEIANNRKKYILGWLEDYIEKTSKVLNLTEKQNTVYLGNQLKDKLREIMEELKNVQFE